MMQMIDAFGPQASPPPRAQKADSKPPCCCHQDMQALMRRAVLHSDGSVDYQIAWGCALCGRRIL